MTIVLSCVLTMPGSARAAPMPMDFSCVGCFVVEGTEDRASDADGYAAIEVGFTDGGTCTPEGLGCISSPCQVEFIIHGESHSLASGFYCDELLDCDEVGSGDIIDVIAETVDCGSVVVRYFILGNKSVFTWAECTKCKKIRTPPPPF